VELKGKSVWFSGTVEVKRKKMFTLQGLWSYKEKISLFRDCRKKCSLYRDCGVKGKECSHSRNCGVQRINVSFTGTVELRGKRFALQGLWS
jgi:hypothetical protein